MSSATKTRACSDCSPISSTQPWTTRDAKPINVLQIQETAVRVSAKVRSAKACGTFRTAVVAAVGGELMR
eukprot:2848252-Prymnesium_polylepis.1